MPDTPRNGQNESSRSPIRLMAEILKDDELDKEDKQLLYEMAKTRFWHRRAMAYIALFGMLALAGAKLFFKADADVAWINATLSAIVVAYIGAAAVRPGS